MEIRDTEFAKNTSTCIDVKMSHNVQMSDNNFKSVESDCVHIKGS
jgi:hypothetical protein